MAITIDLKAIAPGFNDRDLERLSADNPDARFETNREGHLIVMSPTGSESGRKNSDLLVQVGIWNRTAKSGVVFDSSTGFNI